MKREQPVITFDVDGTLLLKVTTSTPLKEVIRVLDPYENRLVLRAKHLPHIKLLKNYVARGYMVIVWSKNGKAWAAEALKALSLTKYVDPKFVMTKPILNVDDEPSQNWMGERVFIPADNSFGRD